MTICCFFASGIKLPKIEPTCFSAWFVKLVDKTRDEIRCRSSITLLSEMHFMKKQDAHSTTMRSSRMCVLLFHKAFSCKNLSFLFKLHDFGHQIFSDLILKVYLQFQNSVV